MSLATYLQFALALIFVVALIGGFAVLARRAGLGGLTPSGKQRRLALVEVLAVDSRRRLVLVRRDATEHLLLLGPTGDVVVESHATFPAFAAALAAAAGESLKESR
ncbi:MAG: flagellar biosynthetic protein FliO [Rhodospirillales bacterium]